LRKLTTTYLTGFSIAAMTLGLLGCASGGGGGTGSSGTISSGSGAGSGSSSALTVAPPPPPPPPPPPALTADSFKTSEYFRMGALDAVHAADAYALGYTGAGITIGVVDFNFVLGSSEVNYNAASSDANPASIALYEAQTGVTSESDRHGHAVAATAAAIKNDFGMHGIAFDASVLAVDYFSNVNETQIVQGGVRYHVSDPWSYLTSRGVRIINKSFGYEGTDIISNPPLVHEAYVIESAAQAVANGALLVASAGNSGGANPSLSNFDIIDDLSSAGILNGGPGAFIIAGAVTNNNTIASFSDRAGSLASIYMVAPGTSIVAPWNGGLAFLSGTSFPAPLISGAAAILLQRWPTLSARQVADILFQTATDLGDPGVDAIYGHGLLDLNAALQPAGVSTFAVADGGTPAVATTALVLGQAFGDAPAFRSATSNATMLDGFGRDFGVDVSRSALSRPGLPDLFGVMQQRLGWHFAGFRVGASSQLDFDVRDNPGDGIRAFGSSGGLDNSLAQHQTIFRFVSASENMIWMAGSGLSLRDALASGSGDDPFAALSLRQGFSPMVGGAPGAFAGLRFDLDAATTLAFGVSEAENQGIPSSYLRSKHHNANQAAALRLDHRMGSSRVGLELGGLVEEGGVLGSLASGGLKMADRSSTSWMSATYETPLSAHWSLKGAMTVSATAATTPSASLIASIGPVYATSFALGIARKDVFGDGDALTFAVDQPLRAEIAPLTLAMGAGRDSTTGKPIIETTQSSLAPSGREVDFESGYRFPLGNWSGAVSLAYSLDAGHVRGENAVAGLFWLSRKF
jgi:hypothetical protein